MAELRRLEGPGATGDRLFERTADILNLARVQVGREHLPGAVHQVVRFVHEEGVVARLFGEVAAQIDFGVEHVVVVTDDDVHPGRQVERKLERADLMLPADGFENRPGDVFARQGRAHGCFGAVVIPASKGAGCRVAGLAFLNADLLLGGERQRAQAEPGLPQVGQGLLRHGASDRARGEVEDALQLAFAQGLDRREEHRDGLADAGGGFEEETPAPCEHAVGGHGQFALARTVVRKGEGH